MSETCSFPLCKQHAYKKGLCLNHNRVYGIQPQSKPVSKPIADKSAKRAALDKEYKALVKELLKQNNQCEVKAPGCTKIAQGMHHVQKRTEKNMLDVKNLVRACNHCNGYIEKHPLWALEQGFSKSKHIQ